MQCECCKSPVQGIIEEGKKKAKKNRPFELSGLGFKPVEYTKSGYVALCSAVSIVVASFNSCLPEIGDYVQ